MAENQKFVDWEFKKRRNKEYLGTCNTGRHFLGGLLSAFYANADSSESSQHPQFVNCHHIFLFTAFFR